MNKLFGATINKGQKYGKSVKDGADEIRDIVDFNKKNFIDFGNFTSYNQLHNHISKCVKPKDFTMILGGDHSISIYTVSALKKVNSDLKVLWIDAHADCNNKKTSPSGNLHGMSMAHLLGYQESNYKCLSPKDITYIGIRDLDPGEVEYIDNKDIKCFPIEHFKNNNLKKCVADILQHIDDCPIHISLDIDVCDPSIAPGTGVPVENGLNKEEICCLIDMIKKTKNVKSLEIVEYFPEFDKNKKTLSLIRDIMSYVC